MTNKILKTVAIAATAIAISACGAEKNFIRVENINNVGTVKHNPIAYSLPKTVLSVRVKAINEISVRGPYYQYAQKYMGTDDIITNNESVWKLGNIDISSYPEKDSTRTYVIDSNYPYSINFSPEGFLESINTAPDFEERYYRNVEIGSVNSLGYDEISSHRQFQDINVNRYETVFDTVLHVVDADSIFTTVPTAKKNLIRKSLDEQAQELANQIFLLRDDRNALLKGESDGKSLPSGEALKYMVDQLNKLEESYMSMFVGKKIRVEKTYVFDFEPSNVAHNQEILFKFSPEYGVQSRTSLKGKPVIISIANLGDNSCFDAYNEQQKTLRIREKAKDEVNGIAYLTNASALVKILFNNNSLSEKVVNVCQMSSVKYLPATMMENDCFKVIFYPQTGTIKRLN
jgi:hypothetical protein